MARTQMSRICFTLLFALSVLHLNPLMSLGDYEIPKKKYIQPSEMSAPTQPNRPSIPPSFSLTVSSLWDLREMNTSNS